MTDSPLRQTLETAMVEHRLSMKDLTVLSPQIDPFRLDTPVNHRDGEWLANAARELGVLAGGRTIHIRGLHYAIVMAPERYTRPDGKPYVNDEDCWDWLSESAAKAARWLGYVSWDRIFDKRNATPIVRIFTKPVRPWSYLNMGVRVDIPDVGDIEPTVGLADFDGAQPYKLVIIGEKASLDEGLSPIAAEHQADLYLPTGNISDTLVHQIARIGAEDGRPMVVLYFSDCDPSGWNMPIEVGRKLQAFKACLYPELEFRQYRALLTPEQVHNHQLPSGPLKINPKTGEYADKRSDRWCQATGTEQTEIDALTTPSMLPLLRRLARQAVAPFYDYTLASRVSRARREWLDRAQAVVDANIDEDALDRLRSEAAAKLATLEAEIEAINEAARIDAADLDLPPIPSVPEPILEREQPMPLLDSTWDFAEQCRALIDSKAYRGGAS